MWDLYDYITNSDLWIESGKRICTRRKEKALSQEKLGQLVNVGRDMILDWEKGHKPIIKTMDLAALSRVLEVDPEYITCQISTYRIEHADAATKYGLSEKTLAILAFGYGYSSAFFDDFFENQKTIASAIDFIVQNINISRALVQLIESEKDAAKRPDSFIPSYYNDIFDDSYDNFCQDDSANYRGIDGKIALSNRQAAFLSEQDFIYRLRKAIENN